MFSEWRRRSKLYKSVMSIPPWLGVPVEVYALVRAAFKAGVRAGIKQEQARRKK